MQKKDWHAKSTPSRPFDYLIYLSYIFVYIKNALFFPTFGIKINNLKTSLHVFSDILFLHWHRFNNLIFKKNAGETCQNNKIVRIDNGMKIRPSQLESTPRPVPHYLVFSCHLSYIINRCCDLKSAPGFSCIATRPSDKLIVDTRIISNTVPTYSWTFPRLLPGTQSLISKVSLFVNSLALFRRALSGAICIIWRQNNDIVRRSL